MPCEARSTTQQSLARHTHSRVPRRLALAALLVVVACVWLSSARVSRAQFDGDELADDELLGVQRRRMNRARSLEPEPWLRLQPVRRSDAQDSALLEQLLSEALLGDEAPASEFDAQQALDEEPSAEKRNDFESGAAASSDDDSRELQKRVEAALSLPQHSIVDVSFLDDGSSLLASLDLARLSVEQLSQVARDFDYSDGRILVPFAKLAPRKLDASVLLDALLVQRNNPLRFERLLVEAGRPQSPPATADPPSKWHSSVWRLWRAESRGVGSQWLLLTGMAMLATIAMLNLLVRSKRRSSVEPLPADGAPDSRLASLLAGFGHKRRASCAKSAPPDGVVVEQGGGESSVESRAQLAQKLREKLAQFLAARLDARSQLASDDKRNPRSSNSYVKSLVDTLARVQKARPARDAADRAPPVAGQARGGSDEAAGVPVLAAMDISAAHLILGFLERHLDERERVARDWRELAASADAQRDSGAVQRTARTALLARNEARNRSRHALPFDKNRVRLLAADNDYINASLVFDDEPRRPTHIIAQAPSEHTTPHFWQMLWEQRVSVIAMLTRLNENGQPLSACYWPGGQLPPSPARPKSPTWAAGGSRRGSSASVVSTTSSATLNATLAHSLASGATAALSVQVGGDEAGGYELQVHLVSEHVTSGDFVVRNMCVVHKPSGETRTLTQFHYLAWPDGGVPESAKSLLQFRRKVNKCFRSASSPVLVHCSDGAARSGTYVLLDMTLSRISRGAKQIDIAATLEHLREQRMSLVATQAQFEFVLVALCEEIQFILNALPQ